MLYRIFIENVNEARICSIVGLYFASFTTIRADGFWRSNAERTLIIEIESDGSSKSLINTLAQRLREAMKQECVMVQAIQCESTMLCAPFNELNSKGE